MAHGPVEGQPNVDAVQVAPPLAVISTGNRSPMDSGTCPSSYPPFEPAKSATTSSPCETNPPKLSTVAWGGMGTVCQVAPSSVV